MGKEKTKLQKSIRRIIAYFLVFVFAFGIVAKTPNSADWVHADEIPDISSDSDFDIDNGVLYDIKPAKHITIPDGVTRISTISLYGNSDIESLSMPDSVTSICNQFIRFCDGMTSLKLSANLTEVEFSAFEGLRSLETLILPDGITDIPEYCCSSMDKVKYIKLPANLKKIGNNAFSSNPNLKAIYIPEGVTDISPTAFEDTDVTLIVHKGSYAEEYAKAQEMEYTYRESFSFRYSTSGNGTCSISNGTTNISNGTELNIGDVVYVTASTNSGCVDLNIGNDSLLYYTYGDNYIKSLNKYLVVLTTSDTLNVKFINKAASINDALYVRGTKNSYTAEGNVISDVYRGKTTAHFKEDGDSLKTTVNFSKSMYLLFDYFNDSYNVEFYLTIDGKRTAIYNPSGSDSKQQVFEISPGQHTIMWTAEKTYYTEDELEIHIDNVQFTDDASEINVSSLSTDYKIVDLRINEVGNISYSLKPDLIAGRTVSWSSNDTSVATISNITTGKATIKGISRGKAVINATVDGYSIKVPVYVSIYSRIGDYEFKDTTLTWYFANNTATVTVPSSTSVIAAHSFDNHSEIKEIIIPESVNEIEGYAFYECNNLERISIPDSVTEIGRQMLPANKNIVIKCTSDSAAFEFAKKYGYKYELTDGSIGQENVEEPEAVVNSRQITEHTGEIGYYDNYIMSDSKYDYIKDGDSIYRYDIAANTFDKEPIITADSSAFQIASRKNVLYIKEYKNSKTVITGYDVVKDKVVYNQEFDFDYNYESFAVDDEQNFFFSKEKDLFIYDKNAVKISEEVTSTDKLKSGFGYYEISQVDPYNRVVLTTFKSTMLRSLTYEDDVSISMGDLGKMYSQINYIGFKPYRNGKLTSAKYYVKSPYSYGNSVWKFFKNGQYGVNAAGQIVNYKKVTNRETGIDYDVLYTIPNMDYYNRIVKACIYGDTIYVANNQNKVYAYDVKKKKVLGTFDMNGTDIHALYQIGNATYVRYEQDGNEYIANLKTKDYIESKTIVRRDHITLTYTKNQVKDRYLATQGKTYDANNSYSSSPSITSPYKAGSLSDGVKKQTLTNLNYVRWQTGLNPVSIYEKYMERSQKGAVIMAANDELTHYPNRPSGMTDEFYKEACAGVGADATYSGNVSWGDSLPDSVFGYVSDSNNKYFGIGHRLSLLDKTVDRTSFGYCCPYSAMSMYYADDPKSLGNDETYYAWPSAGYFPKEVLTIYDKWSVSTDFYTWDSPKVNLEFNGKNYEVKGDNLYYSSNYHTFYYDLPADLKSSMCTKSFDEFDSDITVNVTLSGLLDENGNFITVSYPVNFTKTIDKPLADKDSSEYKYRNLKNGMVSKDGKAVRLNGKLLLLNKIYKDSTGAEYKIIKFNAKNRKFISGEVALVAPAKKTVKKFKVPESIKLSNKTFYVTQISSKAFANCKKLSNVTIGKRVVKIGSGAFSGCKKLKKITINSVKLKKVGKNVFKNANSKIKIYVPKKRFKKYKKLLKKTGLKKGAKILKK